MCRFAALTFALLGFLIPASVPAMDTKELEEYGLIPKSLTTLGINHAWNLEETRQRFTEAGIRPKPPEELDFAIAGMKRTLQSIMEADDAPFPLSVVDLDEIPSECLFYENGIVKRDDVRTVAVCFAHANQINFKTGAKKRGEDRQYLIAVAFDDRRISAAILKTHLSGVYGESASDGEFSCFWRERPWYYARGCSQKITSTSMTTRARIRAHSRCTRALASTHSDSKGFRRCCTTSTRSAWHIFSAILNRR